MGRDACSSGRSYCYWCRSAYREPLYSVVCTLLAMTITLRLCQTINSEHISNFPVFKSMALNLSNETTLKAEIVAFIRGGCFKGEMACVCYSGL